MVRREHHKTVVEFFEKNWDFILKSLKGDRSDFLTKFKRIVNDLSSGRIPLSLAINEMLNLIKNYPNLNSTLKKLNKEIALREGDDSSSMLPFESIPEKNGELNESGEIKQLENRIIRLAGRKRRSKRSKTK